MIGVDTNVLVRYLVGDDLQQSRLSKNVFNSFSTYEPGFISREVMIETVWVLERAYKISRSHIGAVIEGLLAAEELKIEQSGDVAWVLRRYLESKLGFADLMIARAGQRQGCTVTVTFDKGAAGIEEMKLIDG